jgi:putative ABC transport system substrate-binding protein
MTGFADQAAVTTAKRIEILKATVPRATRFGILYTTTTPAHRSILQAAEAARVKLDVQLLTVGVSSVGEFDGASSKMARDRVEALFVQGAILMSANATPLSELALKHRFPTMFGNKNNVLAGGLMSYTADYIDQHRRPSVYIDKILKGAKPGDLPVEQASRYQMVIT